MPDVTPIRPEPPHPVPLTVLPQQPCPYLPDQVEQIRAFHAAGLPPELYHDFMDAGFRRSGQVVYQPACPNCQACLPIRIPTDRFTPSKSQRRCLRRNQDLSVSADIPAPTDEKYDLYRRYLRARHNRQMNDDRQSFELFLYDSPIDSIEFLYRDPAGRLLAVGLCDLCSRSLSSVYFYFDPDASPRGLGNFGVLREIAFARRAEIPWYYLGFWVERCPSMQYKASYKPHQLLCRDGADATGLQWQWREAGQQPPDNDG